MMRSIILLSILLPHILSAQQNIARELVDPFIGTGGHGHTFPGACVPFGLVQLSPDTRPDGTHDWDGASGYHYSDSIIYGFSHTHLSGTGVSDLCDVLLMPVIGAGSTDPGKYRSHFNKNSEKANAGYYTVHLENPNVKAELTSTARAGFHRYTYSTGSQASLVIDLEHRDHLEQGSIVIVSDNEVVGERRSSSWAKDQRLFFCIQFNRPIHRDKTDLVGQIGQWQRTKDVIRFGDLNGEPLLVKVGISAVSIEGARANLLAEVSHWNFDQVRTEAEEKWSKALGRIKIEGGSKEQQRTFYTALYHTMLAPYIFNDVDGNYRGMDGNIHHSDHDVYTVFSLWDTFRTLHPLLTILEPDRTNQFICTMLLHYQQHGRLPVWELWGNETDCMIGYHSVSVIADAYFKGLRGFDPALALDAMVTTARLDHFGLEAYKDRGFISSEDDAESVSRTLEYAYDDWCISKFAEAQGRKDIAAEFRDRSHNWMNVCDPVTKFFRARRNGGFIQPFDPYEVNFHYTEANAWHYSLFVPHHMQEFIQLLGGKEALTQRLDELFNAQSSTSGRDQADITGLIGQYAHGNEPSHGFAWSYNLSSRPFSTEVYVRKILNELYSDKPDGLPGNEDCGQMSAWYVMSAMGLFPLTPGSPEYTLGIPLFDSVEVLLNNGQKFKITTTSQSGSRDQIESITWNGHELDKFRSLRHDHIMAGGELHFILGPRPGSSPPDAIDEPSEQREFIPIPIITAASSSFRDSLTIEISSILPDADLSYRVNEEELQPYLGPFTIDRSCIITAISGNKTVQAKFTKVENELSIELNTSPAPQYSAAGMNALIDGERGGRDFRTGNWQGFQGQDVLAQIDLGRPRKISRIGIGALQDQRSWIWLPGQVQFSFSTNGRQWSSEFATHDVGRDLEGTILRELWTPEMKRKARYIRISAANAGPCPEWHPGAGHPSWIFLDELLFEFSDR
jgi:predicted alpha-1,2-mannosidase